MASRVTSSGDGEETRTPFSLCLSLPRSCPSPGFPMEAEPSFPPSCGGLALTQNGQLNRTQPYLSRSTAIHLCISVPLHRFTRKRHTCHSVTRAGGAHEPCQGAHQPGTGGPCHPPVTRERAWLRAPAAHPRRAGAPPSAPRRRARRRCTEHRYPSTQHNWRRDRQTVPGQTGRRGIQKEEFFQISALRIFFFLVHINFQCSLGAPCHEEDILPGY